MSILRTRKVTPLDGETNLALGDSGDTITIPAGATITNSGTANGFGGGKILQVVFDNESAGTSSNSTTYVDCGLSANITPSSTNSKVLVMFTADASKNRAGIMSAGVKLLRDSTEIFTFGHDIYHQDDTGSGFFDASKTHMWLDSPSTTNSLTYKVQMRSPHSLLITIGAQTEMILMEVAA